MVGLQLNQKFSWHLCFYSIGHMVAFLTALAANQRASQVSCITKISKIYQHCDFHTDGVHDLNCFGKYKSPGWKNCTWKPGNAKPPLAYTVIVLQQTGRKDYCKVYRNIREFSRRIGLFSNFNVTVEALENTESTNCTKAVFTGSPKNLLRCGPPKNASFTRLSGKLQVKVEWMEEDTLAVDTFSMRYKVKGSLEWTEWSVGSDNSSSCTVENLNSSLVYQVQIQCVANIKCSQCLWSEAYIIPQELTAQPVSVNLRFSDIAEIKGRRWIFVSWKFPDTEMQSSYSVNIWKTSGETPTDFKINTPLPEIRIILSYSSYQLNISAFNNVSTSPAVSATVPLRDGTGEALLNVTVHHNNSLTVHWKEDLIQSYACFSVEWWTKMHKVLHLSFHEQNNNYKTLIPLPEMLEPFQRYTLTLHTRPNKETCNLVQINNSESTYASTRFYFIEGSPISAPTKVSVSNTTLTSALLRWVSIPEEENRGFLLGYKIYYRKYDHKEGSIENNVTVDPTLNIYELRHLSSGTPYQVQISAFTSGGTGNRSIASFFKTKPKAKFDFRGLIAVFGVFILVLMFGTQLIKRAKSVLWPSIPNPGNSDAMQEINICELEHLEAISTLKVEEWYTGSLQIIEKELILLQCLQGCEDQSETSSNWIQEEAEEAAGEETSSEEDGHVFSDRKRTDVHTPTCVLASGYTTMVMLQQGMGAITTETTLPEDHLSSGLKQGLDYVRQFSNGLLSESETFPQHFTTSSLK